MPVRGARSAISDASPVDTVTTPARPRPTPRPRRRQPATSSAVSRRASRSSHRITPAARSAASVARASPASEPEWATAAACACALRPTLTALTALPSARDRGPGPAARDPPAPGDGRRGPAGGGRVGHDRRRPQRIQGDDDDVRDLRELGDRRVAGLAVELVVTGIHEVAPRVAADGPDV